MSRGYKRRSIKDSFERARQVPRAEAIKIVSRGQRSKPGVRFIKYGPRLPDIRSLRVMTEDRETKRCSTAP